MGHALAKRLDGMQERGGITGRDVAQLLGTTPQTVSRWRRGRTSPHSGTLERLLRLDWVLDQLAAVYEPDEARLWLFRPHPDLDGRSPAQAIAEDRIDEVLAVIERLQTGAYV
jgi:transcriptional regulator with XRE-family HTH domain